MKICVIACHKQLDQNECSILRELGHEVTSIGFEKIPTLEENSGIIYEPPGFTDDAVLTTLTRDFLKEYDLVIPNHYPQCLGNVIDNYDGPILLRTINSIHSRLETLYKEAYARRPFKIVRMSEKESIGSQIPIDLIIRETVDEDVFNGWNGAVERLITVGKNMYGRFDVDYDIYERVTEDFNRLLVGEENPIRPDTLVGISQDKLLEIMRGSKINYVHPRLWGCITYGFAEAMIMGMPTICLGRHWLGKYWMGSEYIQNGVTGYWSDNIDEIRYIIGKLMKTSLDNLNNLAYNARIKGIELFGKQRNTELWKQILASVV